MNLRTCGRILTALLLVACVHDGRVCRGFTPIGDSQSQRPSEQTVIRVNSDLVTVPVSVTDVYGRPVRDLQLGDFVVEENGNPEPLTRLSEPGQTPIELALLLDLSGSVRPRFELERQAAARFLVRVLRPEDRFTLYSIGPRPGLIQARTSLVEDGLRSLSILEPSNGSTAFFDAVVQAARALAGARIPGWRRVEVALSDGEDNNSESSCLASALEEIQRADCVFYSINPAGPSIHLNKISVAGQEGMSRMAGLTGGKALVPDRLEDLNPIFDGIAAEIRAQYLLEYYSSDQRRDGSFRRINVRIPARPDLRIHARQGYYAAQG